MIKCNAVYIQSKIDSHLFTTLQQSLYAAGHHKNLTVFCLNNPKSRSVLYGGSDF